MIEQALLLFLALCLLGLAMTAYLEATTATLEGMYWVALFDYVITTLLVFLFLEVLHATLIMP